MKNPILHALRCCALLSFLFSFTVLAQTRTPNKKSIPKKDIYVAYDYSDGIKTQRARYYKNEEPGIPLMDGGNNTIANAIFVSGNDVYLAGSSMDKAVYWKNGQMIRVENPYLQSAIISIAVSGSDVYLAGNVCDDHFWTEVHARYWKNGQEVKLPSPSAGGRAWVKSIAVIDNDIYVIGRMESYTPIYWKNGQLMDAFQLDRVALLESINGITYAVGAQNKQAAYWANGKIAVLNTEESLATAIAVSGNDVYVAGVIGSYKYKNLYPGYGNGGNGVYWKNGQLMKLNGAKSPYPTSIAVDGDDVYIVGTDQSNDGSMLWKNGEPISGIGNGEFFGSPNAITSGTTGGDNKSKVTKVATKKDQIKDIAKEEEPKNVVKQEPPKVENIVLNPKEQEAIDFFAENKKKPGIITLPSGLQYEVIKEGTGPKPLISDLVQVSGTRIMMNGKEIFGPTNGTWSGMSRVDDNMEGRTQALLLMNVGSRYRIFIPAKLGVKKFNDPAIIIIEEVELEKIY